MCLGGGEYVRMGRVRARFHADDLGLHPLIDSAILSAYEVGALAGASIVVNGVTFRDAARHARALGMPVALHLNLVDGFPVSSTADVPSLVRRDGRLGASYPRIVARTLVGRVRASEVRAEVRAQLARFSEAGLANVDGVSVDGHQHLHLLPVVSHTILDLAREFEIRRVRTPRRSPVERRQRSPRSTLFAVLEWLGERAARRFAEHGIQRVTCWGALYAGHLTEARVRSVLRSLPAGANGQLLCHPGSDNSRLGAVFPWRYNWQGDLRTVLALGPSLP